MVGGLNLSRSLFSFSRFEFFPLPIDTEKSADPAGGLADIAEQKTQPKTQPKILIGICTLNEAKNIGSLIQQLRQTVPAADILVVDDQSDDGTADIVSAIASSDTQVSVDVRQGRGLGGAIRYAMIAAMKGQYDLFVNMDGDLSHSPFDVPSLIEPFLASDETKMDKPDVIVGSRYTSGGKIVGWPLHRRLMSRLVNRFATLCLRLPVKDCSGSMRCYRVQALRDAAAADLRANGYSVLEEILVAMHRRGASMTEVPIVFTDRTHGESKLTLREALRSMLHMVKLATR